MQREREREREEERYTTARKSARTHTCKPRGFGLRGDIKEQLMKLRAGLMFFAISFLYAPGTADDDGDNKVVDEYHTDYLIKLEPFSLLVCVVYGKGGGHGGVI